MRVLILIIFSQFVTATNTSVRYKMHVVKINKSMVIHHTLFLDKDILNLFKTFKILSKRISLSKALREINALQM